jgi:hypothetical protein
MTEEGMNVLVLVWATVVLVWAFPIAVSISYVSFRLPDRTRELNELFSHPKIREAYLAARRHDAAVSKDDFDRLLKAQISREYAVGELWVAMLISGVTSAAAYTWCALHLTTDTNVHLPKAVEYALYGAAVWVNSSIVYGFGQRDLTAQTHYWIAFRFFSSAAYGLIAGEIFLPSIANVSAFILATLPFAEMVRTVRLRFSAVAGTPIAEDHKSLDKVQGVSRAVLERLDRLGIDSAQQLAFSDPLTLLLRCNVSPKVLIDWMDQAILYCYVGDIIERLRPLGIRGAMEVAILEYKEKAVLEERLAAFEQAAGLGRVVLQNLIENLAYDNQVVLLWKLWETFQDDEDTARNEKAEAPKPAEEFAGQMPLPERR